MNLTEQNQTLRIKGKNPGDPILILVHIFFPVTIFLTEIECVIGRKTPSPLPSEKGMTNPSGFCHLVNFEIGKAVSRF
jgi:hypothetical protein